MVAERSKATCNLSTDCSHQRTPVWIPLEEKIYKVAICTRYNSLPTKYDIDRPESKMTCLFSNSRVPGGFATYNINLSEALLSDCSVCSNTYTMKETFSLPPFNICRITSGTLEVGNAIGLLWSLHPSLTLFLKPHPEADWQNKFKYGSSHGRLEVEQWDDNRTLYLGGSIPAWGVHDYMVPMDPLCYVCPGCVLYVCVSWKTTIKWSTPGHGMTWKEKYNCCVLISEAGWHW